MDGLRSDIFKSVQGSQEGYFINLSKLIGASILWQIDLPFLHAPGSVHVDLGCGKNPRNPFKADTVYGVDLGDLEHYSRSPNPKSTQVIHHDLSQGIPFETDSIDSVSAFDFLEHIPRWERINSSIEFPFINLMSEVFRVLRPGGHFFALTPGVPRLEAFADPTHVNFITRETAQYFCSSDENVPSGKMYGFEGEFKLIHNEWLRGGGPNLEESLCTNFNSNYSSNLDKLIVLLKIMKRSIRMFNFRNPSHIYWVFQKPQN